MSSILQEKDTINLEIQEKLIPHLKSYPQQWQKGDLENVIDKFSKDDSPFQEIYRAVDQNIVFVPNLLRGLTDPTIVQRFFCEKQFYLIGLDDIVHSIELSNRFMNLNEAVVETNKEQTEKIKEQAGKILDLENQIKVLKEQTSILSAKLSNRNLNPKPASEMHAKLASDFAEGIYPVVSDIRSKGHTKLYQIAEQLNSMGLKTRTGSAWSSTAVMRLERRQQEQNSMDL